MENLPKQVSVMALVPGFIFYIACPETKHVLKCEVIKAPNPGKVSVEITAKITKPMEFPFIDDITLAWAGIDYFRRSVYLHPINKSFYSKDDAMKYIENPQLFKSETEMTLDKFESLSAHEKQLFINNLQKDIPRLLNYCDMHDWYMYWNEESVKGFQRIGQAFVNWINSNHLNVYHHYQTIIKNEPKLDIWEQKDPDEVYRFIYNFMVKK